MKTFLVLLALSGCRSWRTRDTIAEVATVGVTLMDWHQTKGTTADCNESNAFIGTCGGASGGMGADLYFASALVVEGAIVRALTGNSRSLFQGAWLGVEGRTVVKNRSLGYPAW